MTTHSGLYHRAEEDSFGALLQLKRRRGLPPLVGAVYRAVPAYAFIYAREMTGRPDTYIRRTTHLGRIAGMDGIATSRAISSNICVPTRGSATRDISAPAHGKRAQARRRWRAGDAQREGISAHGDSAVGANSAVKTEHPLSTWRRASNNRREHQPPRPTAPGCAAGIDGTLTWGDKRRNRGIICLLRTCAIERAAAIERKKRRALPPRLCSRCLAAKPHAGAAKGHLDRA